MQVEIESPRVPAEALTRAAYISFVPIGVANVLLGPLLPTLSERWSLNYAQAGALFTAQYIASTIAVALSGAITSWRGFRFAMEVGILLMATGLALLLAGPAWLGVVSIAACGAGLGIAIPPGNLLVAQVNPERRAAALNNLNFYWSAGAVACPFLVATAAKVHRVPSFLVLLAGFLALVAIGIGLIPEHLLEPISATGSVKIFPLIRQRVRPFTVLAVLFLVYVGTENCFGGWIASFAKSLGALSPTMSLMTPSFFYASLMVGRWLAPFVLRSVEEIKLAQGGLLFACAGTAVLLFSHGVIGVVSSACITGVGLSCVYPISISLLSKEFGQASSSIASVMFVLSNIGGGLLPWIVGLLSNRSGHLQTGLLVPLVGSGVMFLLYLQGWGQNTKVERRGRIATF